MADSGFAKVDRPSRVYGNRALSLSLSLFSSPLPVPNRHDTWYRYFCQVSDFRLPFRRARQWDTNLRVSAKKLPMLVFEKLSSRDRGRDGGCVFLNRHIPID